MSGINAQVLAHVTGRLLERVAEHALDHQLVREPDAEDEPSARVAWAVSAWAASTIGWRG